MKKIGLVLSGGGMRGIGHLGVLKVIEECGIKIDSISGTSAGALIGALFAKGYPVNEILELAKHAKLFGLPHVGSPGLFTMKGFEEVINKYLSNETFETLPTTLSVTATDIVQGNAVYFNSGPLLMPLLASACVPLVFPPIEYNNTLLVDGGIMDNFPIQPLTDHVDVMIGSHVNSQSKRLEHLRMKDILDRSFHFAMGQSVYSKVSQCAIFFDPPEMSRFGMFDIHQAVDIYEYVYKYASGFKEQLLKLSES